jgi:hypothetical protein
MNGSKKEERHENNDAFQFRCNLVQHQTTSKRLISPTNEQGSVRSASSNGGHKDATTQSIHCENFSLLNLPTLLSFSFEKHT